MIDTGLLITIATGAAGGIIALLGEHIYLHFKEKGQENKKRVITFPNEEKIISESIFGSLPPGASIELMKSVLGTPNRIFKDTALNFDEPKEDESYDLVKSEEDERPETNSYLYSFKNAYVKITFKDKEAIDSLTVIAKDNSIIANSLWYPEEDYDENKIDRLNEMKVTQSLVEMSRFLFLRTRYDDSFAFAHDTAAPLYMHYTYFGTPDYTKDIEYNENTPENFVGSIIDGVCISESHEDVYFIFAYELL